MIPERFRRRTKIVATLGPATSSPEMLERLIRAGIDIARLNLSHGTLVDHSRLVQSVRMLSHRLGRFVAVLIDLPGPKYRIGQLASGRLKLKRGELVVLTTREVTGEGNLIPVNLPGLAQDARTGDTVLLADGAVALKVENTAGTEINCRVTVGGLLTEKNGVVIPGRHISAPFLTSNMMTDIDFAVAQKPDYIALSFVVDASDINSVKALLNQKSAVIPIISKIERAEAVRNFDHILSASDGIMVARGDLGVEINLEQVPLLQKEFIRKCNRVGKPVITATEMLESMVKAPRPTRAETSDVANAIFDGTDAVMLSSETSIGKYPVESVKMMAKIARAAEKELAYDQMIAERGNWLATETDELISYNACHTANRLRAAAIVAYTQSGSTARRVSKYRPRMPIVALTPDETVLGHLGLCWGVFPVLHAVPATVDERFAAAAQIAKELKLAHPGDLIVITAGIPAAKAGYTNMLKVEKVT